MFGHENLRAESPFTLHPGRGLYVGVSGNLHPGLCLSCSGPARSLRFVCTLFRQSAFKCLHLFALPGLRHADKKLSCTTRKGVSSSLLVARPFLRGVTAGGILGYRRSNCCTLPLAATGLPIKRKLYRSLLCFNNKRLISHRASTTCRCLGQKFCLESRTNFLHCKCCRPQVENSE